MSVSGPWQKNLLNAQPPAIGKRSRATVAPKAGWPPIQLTSHVHINNKPMAIYQICVTTDHFFGCQVHSQGMPMSAVQQPLALRWISPSSPVWMKGYTFVVGLPVAQTGGEPLKRLRLGWFCSAAITYNNQICLHVQHYICMYSKPMCVFEASNITDGNELVLKGPRCGTSVVPDLTPANHSCDSMVRQNSISKFTKFPWKLTFRKENSLPVFPSIFFRGDTPEI